MMRMKRKINGDRRGNTPNEGIKNENKYKLFPSDILGNCYSYSLCVSFVFDIRPSLLLCRDCRLLDRVCILIGRILLLYTVKTNTWVLVIACFFVYIWIGYTGNCGEGAWWCQAMRTYVI
jgi:hypothetical protein